MTRASFPFHSQTKERFSYHKAIVHMVEKIGFLYNNRELKVVIYMKIVAQRVTHASVTIEGMVYGEIQQGLLLFVGITHEDTEVIADKLAKKCVELRIFEDENGKLNKSLLDIQGSILSISQFTLYADCKKGRRPGFEKAGKPAMAKPLYEYFNEALRSYGCKVETGVFGADMKIDLLNDGPVTIILDSTEL